METLKIRLTGTKPLLMHWDNIEWADQMKEWRSVSENSRKSVAGDDRSPAWTWLGSCYHDGERLVIPHDNIRSMMMAGGAKMPKGKGRGSMKSDAVSGILLDEMYMPLLVNGKELAWPSIAALKDDPAFSSHSAKCKSMGFSLLVKRAAVGSSKHVRVRPMFDKWSLIVPVTIVDDRFDAKSVLELFRICGLYIGLCDWRPGEKKSPGPFGQFTAEAV